MKQLNFCIKTAAVALLLINGAFVNAQVTIGSQNAPDGNALLDLRQNTVDSLSTKGLLFPRVALTNTNSYAPLTAHVKGMTVYNMATAGDVTPGIYVNDGTKWVAMNTEPWNLAGTSNRATLNTQNIYQKGNVGIGDFSTATPAAFLDIETGGTAATPNPTGFKLVDGNQFAGKVLTSDSNGTGTWVAAGVGIIMGNLPTSGVNLPWITRGASKDYQYTGSYIDLPEGIWQVNVTMMLHPDHRVGTGVPLQAGDWLWLRTSFSDSSEIDPAASTAEIESPDITSTGRRISGRLNGPTIDNAPSLPFYVYDVLQGNIVIENKSGGVKRYYYIAGWTNCAPDLDSSVSNLVVLNFGGNAYGEDQIYAINFSTITKTE